MAVEPARNVQSIFNRLIEHALMFFEYIPDNEIHLEMSSMAQKQNAWEKDTPDEPSSQQ